MRGFSYGIVVKRLCYNWGKVVKILEIFGVWREIWLIMLWKIVIVNIYFFFWIRFNEYSNKIYLVKFYNYRMIDCIIFI